MKRICTFGTLLILLLAFIPYSAFAVEVESKMVYATKTEQDVIYEMTQKESFDLYKTLEYYGLKIVKESITPVYTFDTLEYAKTGILNVVPMVYGEKTNLNGNKDGNVYIAKLVTIENEYAGNEMFYIDGDVAYSKRFVPGIDFGEFQSEYQTRYAASCSYVDHAARIQNALNKSEPISVYDVKYVHLDYIGDCFWIENSENLTMIPVGYHNADSSSKIDFIFDETELKNTAEYVLNRHNELKEIREAWEKEHPGELCDLTDGGIATPIVSGCSRVDNIINIFDYIENDMNTPIVNDIANTKLGFDGAKNQVMLWSGIIAGIAALIAAGTFIFVRKKKNKA